MVTAKRVDPYRNCKFLVEIDGITQAGFSDCFGLPSSTDAVGYREGFENAMDRKLPPGERKYTNIALKWGFTDSRGLYDWHRDIVNGKIGRKDGSIVVLDMEGTEKVRWNFSHGWLVKLDGPDFNATDNQMAIETLEIAHEGIERA